MSYFVLTTKIGLALEATAKATGVPIQLSHLAVGDGGGAAVIPSENQTELKREVWRGPLNTLSEDPLNPGWLIAEAVIPEGEGGWTIREFGLIDSAGRLYAVANAPESYKPELAEGSGKTFYIRMRLAVANKSTVTLLIDPSVVLATKEFVSIEIGKVRADVAALAVEVVEHLGDHANPHHVTAAQVGAEEAGAVAGHNEADDAHPDIRAAIAGIVIPAASETVAGIIKQSTAAQALAGTDNTTAMSPADVAAAIAGVVRGYTRQQYPVPVFISNVSGAVDVNLDLHQELWLTPVVGPVTINNPIYTSSGKWISLRFSAASAQTISWGSMWAGTSLVALPTATPAGVALHLSFLCMSGANRMQLMGAVQGA